jgi:hypothetical protein
MEQQRKRDDAAYGLARLMEAIRRKPRFATVYLAIEETV